MRPTSGSDHAAPPPESSPPIISVTWRDPLIAATCGALVFGLYLATVYPGLVPIGDAAKFAFVGKVLGTPHAPGYPLWVMVSHFFAAIPLGTLAYRMNVLSALFGAVAVATSYLIARRLGAGRLVAVCVAVGLGLGQSFWAIALYAKVYTLQATLVATGVLCLLRWSETRRTSDFLWSVAVFSLSVGNHLTVIALLPALVLFALLTDRAAVLRPKVLLASAVMVMGGLSQYLFILVRTLQGAPFMEARARTLGELWGVMTARRFAVEIGAYSPAVVVREQVPKIAGLVGTELGLLGIALFAVGIVALALRQPRRALLLGLGACGVMFLTANMSSQEERGFLLSAFVLLWATVGVGLQTAVDVLRQRSTTLSRVAIPVLAIALPVLQLGGNYRLNDHHRDTFETKYFDALFASLPAKTVFVRDDYHYNMMLLYKLLGEDAAGSRDIRLVRPSDRAAIERFRSDGYTVLAFRWSRDQLAEFGFAFDPYMPMGDGVSTDVLRLRELYSISSTASCREIGNQGWTNLGTMPQPLGRLSIRIDNYRPFDARLILYAAAQEARDPRVVANRGPGTPVVEREIFARNGWEAHARLMDRIGRDGVSLPASALAAPYIIRTEVKVNDQGEHDVFAVDLGVGTGAVMASAVVDQNTPKRATVCSHPLARERGWPSDGARLTVQPDSSGVQFADGWHAVEKRADGVTYRWTTDRAVLVVPIDHPRSMRVLVNAEPLKYSQSTGASLTLVVNGQRESSRELRTKGAPSEWTIPAEALHAGLNEFVLEVNGAHRPVDIGMSPDSRMLGASVMQIDLVAEHSGKP